MWTQGRPFGPQRVTKVRSADNGSPRLHASPPSYLWGLSEAEHPALELVVDRGGPQPDREEGVREVLARDHRLLRGALDRGPFPRDVGQRQDLALLQIAEQAHELVQAFLQLRQPAAGVLLEAVAHRL